jgi:segregation and condensation protein B
MERRLVTTAGRKAVMGRPILYRTSKDFLMRFGLNDVDELPSLKEFEELARAALGADAGLEQGELLEMPSTESAAADTGENSGASDVLTDEETAAGDNPSRKNPA